MEYYSQISGISFEEGKILDAVQIFLADSVNTPD